MEKLLEMNQAWIREYWEKIEVKMRRNSELAKHKLPRVTVDGVYDDHSQGSSIGNWTNGFWPGIMWLMYAATKEECYKETAEYGEAALDRALEHYEWLHHDVGFMWHISAGANYRLTGNRASFVRNIYAANTLASRYNLKGGYIRAWNGDATGFAIIDCMMNIPLLYWASREIGDDRFKYIAMSHADKTLKYHVREDGSVNHINEYDPETGELVKSHGGQGYGEGSSWSRGQAWALYGFTLSYIHTGEQRYLDTAKKVANYFISAVCSDWLPRCDFRAPVEPVVYDSSAGLIAANGLIELSKCVGEYERDMYFDAAVNLVKAISDKFADWSDETDAIIGYGTERYGNGEHIDMVYSDFYYVEALNKLKGFNTFLW